MKKIFISGSRSLSLSDEEIGSIVDEFLSEDYAILVGDAE
jgi:hypothetical protein